MTDNKGKKKIKRKERKNDWLDFVKKCHAEEKAKGSGKKYKDVLKECSAKWAKMKEEKNKN